MKSLLRCLIVTLLIEYLSSQKLHEGIDPCLESEHKILKNPYRSTKYDLRPTDTRNCDDNLARGWYRFIDSDGKSLQMATSCPGKNNCGTVMPLWMDGPHPKVDEGIRYVDLCGQRPEDPETSCCGYTNRVYVKQCPGGFFVYDLFATDSRLCSGYCAGNAQRCSVDQWSTTDFEPCRDRYPILKTPPALKGPIVNKDQAVEFKCQIVYDKNANDQRFEVAWTFDGRADPKVQPQTISGREREVTLGTAQLQNHVDQEIGCQVTTYFVGRESDKSKPYQSKVFYFGIKDAPVLNGPTVRGQRTFDFQCLVAFDSTEANQRIEVVWTFDGKEDLARQPDILTGQRRSITLEGSVLQAHVNKNIGCQARLIYGNDLKTTYRKSSLYYFGIKVNPTRLDIKESDLDKELTVTSTVPVVCDQGQDCCVTLRLKVSIKAVVTIKDTCEYKICSKDWNPVTKETTFKIKVVPNRTDVNSGTRKTNVAFEGFIVTGTNPYIAIWKSLRLNPVEVVVILQAGFMCSITGDPHFKGFDYQHPYHLYMVGDYIAYEVKSRDFVVQIRTWQCWAVTCVCGVIVKEKGNIIRVFGCNTPHRLKSSTISIPSKLSKGTVVLRSLNAQHIGITFPSGSEIKIDLEDPYMNIFIKTPAYDRNQAKGLCGTNDGNPANDFTHRNGQVSPICPPSAWACIPNAFSTSWSVVGKDSLFEHIPPYKNVAPEPEHCACEGQTVATCSPGEHSKNTAFVCNGCPQITERVPTNKWGIEPVVFTPVSSDKQWSDDLDASDENPNKQWLSDQEFLDEEYWQNDQSLADVDPNKKWPNDAGITEAQAIEMCNKNIQTSQLYSRCQSMDNNTEIAMNNCLNDILFGGTTEAMDSIVSAFTTNCQASLAADEKNYIENAEGDLLMDPVIMNVCPIECRKHGNCNANGKCVCNKGWEGETCHIETGKGAVISWSTGSPLCSANDKICDSVNLEVTNVNLMDKIQCRVHTLDNQDQKNSNPVLSASLQEASPVAVCPLPQKGLSTQNFTVSVTIDGKQFSNELRVDTYDSTCLTCTNSGCVEKTTACHIDGVCYKDKEYNKNDAKLICDISRQTTAWSLAPVSSAITTSTLCPWLKTVTVLATTLVLVVSASRSSSLMFI